jgi:hypothetical protein
MQNAKATEDLQQKNLAIVDLQKRLSDQITGGDDFCSVSPFMPPLQLFPPISNPIYDLAIVWRDSNLASQFGERDDLFELVMSGNSFNAIGSMKWDRYITLGTVLPGRMVRLPLPDVHIVDFPFVMDARFFARNGRWHQAIIVSRGEDGFNAIASFVVRGNKLIRSFISPNFPEKDKIFRRRDGSGTEHYSSIPFYCAAERRS